MKLLKILVDGIWSSNPVLRLVLGTCPTLAVTTSVKNGLGMGLATLFVLIGSNAVISMLRKLIPDDVRIPCYIVVISTFVTVVDLLTNAYFVELYKALGIFIPLIVVNCIVFGRAEGFASKNGVVSSIFDAIGMGIGFTLALVVFGSIREFLGTGGILGYQLTNIEILVFVLPPGAFLTFGSIVATMNYIDRRANVG